MTTAEVVQDKRKWVWLSEECLEEGCGSAPVARDLCSLHYQRHRTAGTLPPKVRCGPSSEDLPAPRRIWSPAECLEEGCAGIVRARGLCVTHYNRRRKNGLLPPIVREPEAWRAADEFTCEVSGCVNRAHARGLCGAHYRRSLRYGLGFQELAAVDACDRCEACGDEIIDVKGAAVGKHLDHVHATNELRGVLCQSCNTSLGLLGESVPRLVGLLNYLVKWQERTKA